MYRSGKVQGYHSVEIKDAGVLIAYNDGTLLGVYGGSSEQLQNCNRLSLPSCNSPPTKASMQTNISLQCYSKKGDIRLLATPDALPMDVRGVLNWPHGTQLLGYVLFENGRIYATLQSADFKGDTKEDNQPLPSQKLTRITTSHVEYDAWKTFQHLIDQRRIAHTK